ncbi:hypothetical protein FA95DRAFT_1606702 [Auriscalpium vulgare]|uniref:Uncharacterized protein n=1 Tax=Auriscalpium vulgare TaxID=40419 RepID=A0ACB8RSN7_9AGAM|nr:hypothetical protein FA95DRAFT_1606702 [Auriscalpium vulgare]
MDPFAENFLYSDIYAGQQPFAPDIGVTAGASAHNASSPTLSAHLSSTSYVSSSAFVAEQEQQQPFDPWSPDWDMWIDAQLKLLLLNAEPAPATSISDVDNSYTVDPAILSLAHTGYAVEVPVSREQSPEPGAPMMPMPLTHSESLDRDPPPTTVALAVDWQQQTNAAHAGEFHPASTGLPSVPTALPQPLFHRGSSTAAFQAGRKTRRKTRAHPYALVCPECPFVQENGRSWDMKRHVKTHDAVRNTFSCERRGCEESFSRMDAVRRHQKNVNARCAMEQGDDA